MTKLEVEKTTIDNAVAISRLTIIAEKTSKDVDKLITHLDNIPAVRIVSLEKRISKVEDCCANSISKPLGKWIYSGTMGTIIGVFYYMLTLIGVK